MARKPWAIEYNPFRVKHINTILDYKEDMCRLKLARMPRTPPFPPAGYNSLSPLQGVGLLGGPDLGCRRIYAELPRGSSA